MREWYLENKEDIKTVLIISLATILICCIVFVFFIMSMTNDLVNKVTILESTVSEMQYELSYEGALINTYMDREERCKNGEDIGDSEYSIICIPK